MIRSEPDTTQADLRALDFARQFGLTAEPVLYRYETGVAYCCREPYKSCACLLEPGDPVCLRPDRLSRSIAIWPSSAKACGPAGFLYAQDAAFMGLLLDCPARQGACAQTRILDDTSLVSQVLLAPPPSLAGAQRLRYPKLTVELRLRLSHAWPLFTILAVLHLKDDQLPACAGLRPNPWLEPLAGLRQAYRSGLYDAFVLPDQIAAAWLDLTGGLTGR
ncbi:MAG: hypothetical protein GX112_10515 [Clostridiaceae bacterium]|jgi:hypothetical protein|nr:hypothetical protein [Clostridiaceae bacterium]